MAFLVSEGRVGGDWAEDTSGERSVDTLEEFEKEDAQAIALGQQSRATRMLDPLHEAFGAQFRQVVAK